jgi:hypothetical protein
VPPPSFLDFVSWLSVALTDAQRVLAAVAFDGAQPRDMTGADRELARQLFGDVDTIPPEARTVLVAVCGARAGKTYVLVALRMLHLAFTVSLSSLAPGEQASAIIVAPDLRLARQALRYVAGAVEAKPELKALCTVATDSVAVDRDGQMVSVECLPASRGGSAVRGRSLVGAALDEAAFFRDDNSVVNDTEVFKALAPRIMPGGQLVIASTPWAESGLLYDLFHQNHGRPTTALAVQAPTTVLRSDTRTAEMVARERARDPENAAREFDAQFMAVGSGLFFDPSTIDRAFDSYAEGNAQGPCTVAADLAFTSDYSAFAAVASGGGSFSLVDCFTMKPERGKPLAPSAVMGKLAAFAKEYGASTVHADVHYQETVRETLGLAGISFAVAPVGQQGKTDQYSAVRSLFNEGRVRLPPVPGLGTQLKAVVSRPTPGGGLKISSPRRAGGGHGDLVSALVLALWAAQQNEVGAIDWHEHDTLMTGSKVDDWGMGSSVGL